jgi:hypothetical protein
LVLSGFHVPATVAIEEKRRADPGGGEEDSRAVHFRDHPRAVGVGEQQVVVLRYEAWWRGNVLGWQGRIWEI